MRGYHRTCLQAMPGPLVKHDWKNCDNPILYPGICPEGLMRNGVNDSNHRGVWFYLHFLHPFPPTPQDIVVELEVRQSSIHARQKHHMKYCATPDEDAPGDVDLYVDILALHLPLQIVPPHYWP